jgi:hypothetical protein
MLALDELGRCCLRCGSDRGDSLTATGELVADILGLQPSRTPAQLVGVQPVTHRNPDECLTGRPAYDAHTRLALLHGLDGVWPAGGAVTARLWCGRGKKQHQVGRLYETRGGSLLLCRWNFGRPFVRQGTELVRTMALDFLVPVMLEDALATPGLGMQCPHRVPLEVDTPLVQLLRTIGRPTQPYSVSLPVSAVRRG